MKVGSPLRGSVPLVLASVLLTCGGKSPTGSTPASPPPTTRPTPTPTPTAPPSVCQTLGYVASSDARCSRQNAAKFQSQVDGAISKVIAEHGEIFENGPGGIRIRNFGAYIVYLLKNLEDAGLCSGYDGEEVQVKNSNDFNEQFDVSSSSGYVRMGDPAYRSTCMPAAFPTPPPPPIPPPPGCSLPSSLEIACGPANPSFLGDVKAAIDQAVAEHPEIFDQNDTAKGAPDSYKVLDPVKYYDYVLDNLRKKGLCARFDGEEVVIKTSNTFSDHYDILTGDSHIRRGDGEYRVSCYPAAF